MAKPCVSGGPLGPASFNRRDRRLRGLFGHERGPHGAFARRPRGELGSGSVARDAGAEHAAW